MYWKKSEPNSCSPKPKLEITKIINRYKESSVNQLIFADINFRVFIFIDIFAATHFHGDSFLRTTEQDYARIL